MSKPPRFRTAAPWVSILMLAGLLAGCFPPPPDAYKLNPGAYKENYIKLVASDSPYLDNPTGKFPKSPPPSRLWAGYRPEKQETDNMDLKTLELQDKGYVMIGYAAVNTRERGEKTCDKGTMAKAEYDACRYWTSMSYVNPDADPLGDPIDAAITLNAAIVAVQRDFSFSRNEVLAKRIVTADSSDRSKTRASSSYSSRTASQGSSSTSGWANTSGNDRTTNVGGSANASGTMFGPVGFGSVGGEVHGDVTNSNYNSNARSGSYTNDRAQSRTAGGEDQRSDTQHSSQQWATALVDKSVDHYDYVATFWKKGRTEDMILGAFTDPLPRELWELIGSRSARVVRAVIGNTPAYSADMWEGDILVSIDDEKIEGESGLQELLRRKQGRSVVFTIFRKDDFYKLPVTLRHGTAVGSTG